MPTAIPDVLATLAAEDPHRLLVTCGEESLTRAEADTRSNRLARAYEDLGVKAGDFVTIGLPNGPEFALAAFATWKLGAIPQPVSPRLPARELTSIVELANSSLIVGLSEEVVGGRPHVAPGFEAPDHLSSEPIVPTRVSPSWKAPTSGGSTGVPKLIVSGGSGLIEPEGAAGFGLRKDGVLMIPGPLYHNGPFTWSFNAMFFGNHVILFPRFDAVAVLEAIAAHRIEVINVVPTMMLRMLRVIESAPSSYDLSSLRFLYHTAAPCPDWLKERWIELLGPEKIVEMYGGTEAQSLTLIAGDEWLTHRGSVGRPIYGEMAVFDENGCVAPAGQVGEVYMRGPQDAPATYRYIGAEARTRGGWESLGDLGWMDAEGFLFLADRRTDMILSGGANVYPAEVEAALCEHPMVDGAVVIGIPDDDLGQRVHAVVQTIGELSTDDLVAFVSERLVRYKVPRSLRLVTDSLRDDAGKVRRSAIREDEIARLSRPSR